MDYVPRVIRERLRDRRISNRQDKVALAIHFASAVRAHRQMRAESLCRLIVHLVPQKLFG
jgi:hypothetical protein